MSSRLVYEEFCIEVDGEEIILRPTLRAATLVLARYGDLTTAFRSVTELNVTVIADLIRIGSGQRLPSLHYALCSHLNQLGPVADALMGFLAAIDRAGSANDNADAKPTPKKGKKAKGLTLAEYHARLFEMGSGVMGWSPADVWESTPAEIEAAHKGRIEFVSDLLKAVFGGSDDKPITDEDRRDMVFDEAGYAELRMMAGRSGAEVR